MRFRTLACCAALAAAAAGCTADRAGSTDEPRIEITLTDAGPGPQCGPSTCAFGMVCCNESCGICTEPGGFCTLQLCGVQPPPRTAGDTDGDGTVDMPAPAPPDVFHGNAHDWDWARGSYRAGPPPPR